MHSKRGERSPVQLRDKQMILRSTKPTDIFWNAVPDIDFMPRILPPHLALAQLKLREDSHAVIKLIGSSKIPKLRYVPRTQFVDLDFVHQMMRDPLTTTKYGHTKGPIVNFLTNGSFERQRWESI